MDIPYVVCAFGHPHGRPIGNWHCVECAKEGIRQIRAFWADVAAGTYDEDGYTPAERRAKNRADKDARERQEWDDVLAGKV